MACPHDGYHSIQSAYNRLTGELVYFWTCERCGTRLREAGREDYRPAFVPTGKAGAPVADGR